MKNQGPEKTEYSYLQLFNSIDDGIYIIGGDGKFIDMNESVLRTYGYSKDEIVGKSPSFLAATKKDIEPLIMEVVKSVFKNKTFERFEMWGKKKSGEKFPLEIICNLGEYLGNKVIISTARDITDRRQAQQALKNSEEKFSKVFHLSPDGILLTGIADSNVLDANAMIEQLTGYTRQDLLGTSTLSLGLWEHPSDREEYIAGIQKNGFVRHLEKTMITKTGDRVPVELFGVIVEINNQPCVITVVHDITERRKAEETARENELRWQLALESAQHGVWDRDFKKDEVFYSVSWKEMLGYADHEIKNELNEWDKRLHPDDKAEVYRLLEDHLQGKTAFYQKELRMLRKDGTYMWIQGMGQVIARDKQGKPLRMIGTHLDITARKTAEAWIQKTQRSITEDTIREQETEKTKISNELHENINQILAAAKIYLGIVQAKADDKDLMLKKSYDSLDQAMELINKLSSSLNTPLIKDFGLLTVLRDLAEEINKTNTIHVIVVDKTHTQHLADNTQTMMLYRIIQSQLDNIIKHSKARNATITLETNDRKIILEMRDDGNGCDIKTMKTGYGLMHIRNRVELYGGKMEIDSAPGKGWAMHIELPAQASFRQA